MTMSPKIPEKNTPNKFVTSICEQVDDLTGPVDIKKVTTEFDKNKVQNKDSNCAGGGLAEDLVMGE